MLREYDNPKLRILKFLNENLGQNVKELTKQILEGQGYVKSKKIVSARISFLNRQGE